MSDAAGHGVLDHPTVRASLENLGAAGGDHPTARASLENLGAAGAALLVLLLLLLLVMVGQG